MTTFENLIFALAVVESALNPLAIGDNGKAVGYLQITPAVVQDVNEFYKMNYTLEDRFDKEKSKQICFYYLNYWGKIYRAKTGEQPTAEIYAKMWNGGAYAWKKINPLVKKNLALYWNKVRKELNE